MIHEARIIPLDGRPQIASSIKQYMGDARGRWEGNTLVVETTNFHPAVNNRGATESLRLIERFTPVSPNKVEWSVTVDDPNTWSRPWTFAMPLTMNAKERVMEYACHEGNRALENMLRVARAEEAARGNAR